MAEQIDISNLLQEKFQHRTWNLDTIRMTIIHAMREFNFEDASCIYNVFRGIGTCELKPLSSIEDIEELSNYYLENFKKQMELTEQQILKQMQSTQEQVKKSMELTEQQVKKSMELTEQTEVKTSMELGMKNAETYLNQQNPTLAMIEFERVRLLRNFTRK